jgi:hypothetical protein
MYLKIPIDSIVWVSMQNDGHRGLIVFHPPRQPSDACRQGGDGSGCVAPGDDAHFTIYSVAESTNVPDDIVF